jgi:hypothetical protein
LSLVGGGPFWRRGGFILVPRKEDIYIQGKWELLAFVKEREKNKRGNELSATGVEMSFLLLFLLFSSELYISLKTKKGMNTAGVA